MTLTRLAEIRDITQWEPSDGEPVPVHIEYLGRKAVLRVDRVTVTRVTYRGDGSERTGVDVTLRTRDNGARFGQWAWHSNEPESTRRILAEGTATKVWSLLVAEAPESLDNTGL